MALAGITPTPVGLEAMNNDNDIKATTVTPGTGKIHVTETIALDKQTVLGSTGSLTIVDGLQTAGTAAS